MYGIILTCQNDMGGFPSGQRGQTVNLLQLASVVRIHLRPLFRNEGARKAHLGNCVPEMYVDL